MNIKKLIQEHNNKKRSWKALTPLDKNLKKFKNTIDKF